METINNFKGLLVYTTSSTNFEDTTIRNISAGLPDISDYVILDRVSNKPYPSEVLTIAKKIYAYRPDARFWIGTPKYDQYTHPSFDFIKGSIEEIKSTFINDSTGQSIWNSNVKGIYLNMESIYGEIDYSLNINQNTDTCISVVKNVSSYVHNTLDLNLLWIPYYGFKGHKDYDLTTKTVKDLAYMVARTDFFDIVIIQPHYYFGSEYTDDSVLIKNLDAIKYSMNCSNICYRDGVQVFTRTHNRAKIGFEMEMDDFAYTSDGHKTDEKRIRYEKYVNAFNSYKDYPMCYYAGGLDTLKYNYPLIGLFFDTVYGDADGSGTLTANDAAMIQQYTLTGAPSDYIVSICDVDGSGYLTAADSAHVLQKSMDNSYTFPLINKIYNH